MPDVLTNTELENRCKASLPDFVGVFSRDDLPPAWKPGSYILNLQGLNQGDKQGTHWVAFHLTNTELDFFDPFGSFPPQDVLYYATMGHPNLHLRFSPWVIQGIDSQACGMIAYAWLLQGARTGDYYNAAKTIFTDSTARNDVIARHIWLANGKSKVST